MSAPIVIDASKCRGCTKCVKGCGFGALTMHEKKAVLDPSACKACGACVKTCPFGAISEVRQKVNGTANLDQYKDIWVFAEQHDGVIAPVAFELLAKAQELKAQRGEGCCVGAVLLGHDLSATLEAQLASHGADKVYKVDAPALKDYEANVYVDAVAQLAQKYKPEVILAGATAVGRAFFARVAVRLRTGLTADCTMLKIERTHNKDTDRDQMLLHQTRPAFGGNIMATIMTPNHRPQMATVRPKVFKAAPPDATHKAQTLLEALTLIAPQTHLAKLERDLNSIDIASAEVLVSGGRGLKNAENFKKLYTLAQKLGGEVAASRACVDAGWCPVARQVGQTGKTVAPRFYLCFGISGAIQHLEGIRGADIVIAVNNDPAAPIFSAATLGIVADAAATLDALIAKL